MVTMQNAIELAQATHKAIAAYLATQSYKLEAELRDAHEGQGNKGNVEDWLREMADNDNGTLQNAAIELLAKWELSDVMYAARSFLNNAGYPPEEG